MDRFFSVFKILIPCGPHQQKPACTKETTVKTKTHLLVPFISDPLDLNLFPTHDALQVWRQKSCQSSGEVPLKG